MQIYDTKPFAAHKDFMINTTCVIDGTAGDESIFTHYGKEYINNENDAIYNYAFIGPNFDTPDCSEFYPTNNGGWMAYNNSIYINNGNEYNTGYCGVSIDDLKKSGLETGTTVGDWPDTQFILDLAKQILYD